MSEVIFARRPQVAAGPGPRHRLLELPTGAVTPVPPPRVADTLSSSLGPPRWRTPVLVGLGALVRGGGVLALRGGRSGLDEAATQLDAGKAREALTDARALEKTGRRRAELAGLRAAALHAVRDHATELKVLLGAREMRARCWTAGR